MVVGAVVGFGLAGLNSAVGVVAVVSVLTDCHRS